MPKPHFYAELDKNNKFTIEMPMRQVAEQIVAMNHGKHRFLSHLIDAHRASVADRVKMYEERGDHDVAGYAKEQCERFCSAVLAAIEALYS